MKSCEVCKVTTLSHFHLASRLSSHTSIVCVGCAKKTRKILYMLGIDLDNQGPSPLSPEDMLGTIAVKGAVYHQPSKEQIVDDFRALLQEVIDDIAVALKEYAVSGAILGEKQ